jgi:hypothetical protein
MSQLKSICYPGGIARFQIPASWKEEYQPSAGATFYEDRPDSGTLRLNVLSFHSNGGPSCDETISGLIAKSGYEPLGKDLAVKQYVQHAEEDGEQLQIYYWEIAVPVKPHSVRLAIFSYAILASQADDREVCDEIELLNRSIRSAEFSREQ